MGLPWFLSTHAPWPPGGPENVGGSAPFPGLSNLGELGLRCSRIIRPQHPLQAPRGPGPQLGLGKAASHWSGHCTGKAASVLEPSSPSPPVSKPRSQSHWPRGASQQSKVSFKDPDSKSPPASHSMEPSLAFLPPPGGGPLYYKTPPIFPPRCLLTPECHRAGLGQARAKTKSLLGVGVLCGSPSPSPMRPWRL